MGVYLWNTRWRKWKIWYIFSCFLVWTPVSAEYLSHVKKKCIFEKYFYYYFSDRPTQIFFLRARWPLNRLGLALNILDKVQAESVHLRPPQQSIRQILQCSPPNSGLARLSENWVLCRGDYRKYIAKLLLCWDIYSCFKSCFRVNHARLWALSIDWSVSASGGLANFFLWDTK